MSTPLQDKTVLVTGGAGSLGLHLVRQLLFMQAKAVRVLDFDEYGLFLLGKQFEGPRLRLLLGDIRDRERMTLALKGIDYVVHAAAAKNIEITEYNMPEAVRINVAGTINLLETAMTSDDVEKFLFVSSDKAVHFSTLYGATKFIGEKLISWADQVSDKKFSSVRMGNFLESRGNVFDVWARQKARGEVLTLTSSDMKRYFIRTEDAARVTLKALELMQGGETFVPKIRLSSVFEAMKELYPDAEWKEVGPRRGEKIEEELMTVRESGAAEEREGMWILREK